MVAIDSSFEDLHYVRSPLKWPLIVRFGTKSASNGELEWVFDESLNESKGFMAIMCCESHRCWPKRSFSRPHHHEVVSIRQKCPWQATKRWKPEVFSYNSWTRNTCSSCFVHTSSTATTEKGPVDLLQHTSPQMWQPLAPSDNKSAQTQKPKFQTFETLTVTTPPLIALNRNGNG